MFVPQQLELGELPWDAQVPIQLLLSNGSSEPVTVALVKSSCGCTILDTESYVGVQIAPGDVLPIEGTLDVGGALGSHSRKIDVLLESGELHTAFIVYSTFATYAYSPRQLDLGRIDLDAGADDLTARVLFTSPVVSLVEAPITDSAWLEAGLHDRGNGEVEILVNLIRRNLSHGRNVGRVTLRTDDGTRPEFSVFVRCEAFSELRALPSHLILRPNESRSVRFITSQGADARIVSAATDDDSVSITIDEARTTVTVSLSGVEQTATRNAIAVRVEDERAHVAHFLVSRAIEVGREDDPKQKVHPVFPG